MTTLSQMSNVKSQNHKLNVKSDIKLRAYKFSLSVIDFVVELPDKKVYWVFSDQLLRAGTSIGANIVEAKSSSSKREFIKYYEIALKSANEAKYWLCLLRDSPKLKDINRPAHERLLQEAIELGNMLGSALLTMKGKKI